MTRRIIAILLALVLGTGVCVSASADEATELQAEKQIVAEGGENASTGGKVQISQTVKPTGNENLFDVTLKVRTEQEIKETVSSDIALMLEIDLSGSMAYCVNCSGEALPSGYPNPWTSNVCNCGHYQSRFETAMANIKPLINELSTSDDKRILISIVTFAEDPDLALDWTDSIEDVFNTLDSYDIVNVNYGSTHLAGGTQYAANNWGNDAIAGVADYNRFTILLTDGEPNTHDRGPTGTEAQDLENLRSKCNLIAIGYKVDLPLLRDHSDYYYTADNADELKVNFEATAQLIKLLAEAWSVEAELGENLEYIELRSEDNGSVSCADGKLSWDLKKESPKKTTEGTKTYYEYEMTYRTRLKTEAEGFESEKAYPVNVEPTLSYVFYNQDARVTDEDGNVLTGELEPYTLAFPVPEVKGYLGNLKITKLGSDGKAVPGVRFMVTGEYGGELSGESGADGKLGFSLPSGYSYEISEDSAPEDI